MEQARDVHPGAWVCRCERWISGQCRRFVDANKGWVFAGTSSDAAQSQALILKTSDGGKTWRTVYRSARKFENSWKGSMIDARTGYATVQSYDPARAQQVIVKTVDGGESWRELPLVANAKARQFGIGFASERVGWVGTAVGGFETRDGGLTWKEAPLAVAANKIRVRAGDGTKMIYAIGTQVQRLGPASVAAVPNSPRSQKEELAASTSSDFFETARATWSGICFNNQVVEDCGPKPRPTLIERSGPFFGTAPFKIPSRLSCRRERLLGSGRNRYPRDRRSRWRSDNIPRRCRPSGRDNRPARCRYHSPTASAARLRIGHR